MLARLSVALVWLDQGLMTVEGDASLTRSDSGNDSFSTALPVWLGERDCFTLLYYRPAN